MHANGALPVAPVHTRSAKQNRGGAACHTARLAAPSRYHTYTSYMNECVAYADKTTFLTERKPGSKQQARGVLRRGGQHAREGYGCTGGRRGQGTRWALRHATPRHPHARHRPRQHPYTARRAAAQLTRRRRRHQRPRSPGQRTAASCWRRTRRSSPGCPRS